MSNDIPGDDGAPSDPWLRQALRHAPDADAAPPAALRDAILRKASAVGPATLAQPSANAWDRLLAWLARPVMAAGFASLAISIVLTLWWSTGSLDEGRGVEPVAALPAPAPASGASERPSGSEMAALKAPAETARLAVQAPKREKQAAAGERGPTVVAAASPPAPAAPQRIEQAEAAAPAPVQAPPATADTQAERREPAQATANAERLHDEQRLGRFSASRLAESRRGDPLQALAGAGSEALTWRVAGLTYRHGLEQRTWLDELSAAASGRWQRSGGETVFDVNATRLEVLEGDALRGELVIGARQAWWTSPGQGAWHAPLDETVARRLRAQAAGW